MMKTFKTLYVQIKRYGFRSVFFGNFQKFFIIIVALGFVISIITYIHFNSVQNRELLDINAFETQKDAKLADNLFREAEYIASNLIIDKWIGIYISDIVTEESSSDISYKVQNKLSAYLQINEYVDSIYIYSPIYNKICTATSEVSTKDFSDNSFLNFFNNQTESFIAWSRLKENKYPYLISFGKKKDIVKCSGGVVVNIDTEKLTDILVSKDDNSKKMYIVGNDGKILYSKDHEEYMQSYKTNVYLSEIIESIDTDSCIVDEYVVSSYKSDYYDWKYIVINSEEVGKRNLNRFYYTIWIIIGIMLMLGMILAVFMGSVTLSPIIDIVELLENPKKYKEENLTNDNELKYIENKIMLYIYSNENLKNEIESRNAMLDEIQLYALQQQINPHFINNTINIINLMLVSEFGKNHKSTQMLRLLSKQLNNCLRLDNILITLENEIENTNIYVELLKCRNNKFDVIFDIDEELKKEKIIKMILQPLVENSMFHGFRNLSQFGKRGEILISAKKTEDGYILSVSDNGVGIEENVLNELKEKLKISYMDKTETIGLVNVNRRLKIMFGEEYGLEIESQVEKGTEVKIRFPI